MYFPVVSFIYDPRENRNVPAELHSIATQLGTSRIYHISISPNAYTAQQVADGAFDQQYRAFFEAVKKENLKVIFRTMHEMNGGWYPWSSNPEAFKKAWIHVWTLSRETGLDRSSILFDMSVNAWDLPTKDAIPTQTSRLIECKPAEKAKLKCASFEDYYPGDEYVDLLGFTFYNWGKGNSNRWRGSPDKIVNNPTRSTLSRLKAFNKPIFVDEVGTTAVDYPENYSYEKSLQMYENEPTLKNQRLLQLKDFLLRETKIVGAIYFNVDLTSGLKYRMIGELDWAIINMGNGKFYDAFWQLYTHSDHQLQHVLDLFGLKVYKINGSDYYLTPLVIERVKMLEDGAAIHYPRLSDRFAFYQQLAQTPSKLDSFNEALKVLLQAYKGS